MWIVTGTKKELVSLVSARDTNAILPKGSFLTVEDDEKIKHILLVEESYTKSLFEPSPLIVDADLPVLSQDQECKNIVYARELKQFPIRQDGLFNHIKPNEKARRTSQEEIDTIFGVEEGYPIFLATNYLQQCSLLKDDKHQIISVKIPFSSLYYQTMICGQTGTGKTVAMKYIIEQFLEHEKGAVLAINIKKTDLLTMDQPTTIKKEELKKAVEDEWNSIGYETISEAPFEYSIYIPYTMDASQVQREGVTKGKIDLITLRARDLEPNALLGILQNVTDRAAEALPNIFRYWKERVTKTSFTFREFISWFDTRATKENGYVFPILSQVEEDDTIPLHPGTCDAIRRSLVSASPFFDNPEGDSIPIQIEDILVKGKLSVIDLSNKDTLLFGSVLLRHLLSKIYESKSRPQFDMPILIVIDEVHHFYKSGASIQALEELNAIARMGRSEKIGVIFASQNPEDLPEGINSIVNTRIFFRSLGQVSKKFGVSESGLGSTTLENGYALFSCYAMPHIKFVKFPIPRMGVKS